MQDAPQEARFGLRRGLAEGAGGCGGQAPFREARGDQALDLLGSQAGELGQPLAQHGPKRRGRDLLDQGLRLGEEARAPLFRRHVDLGGELGEQELREGLGGRYRLEERRLALAPHVGIGIVLGGQEEEAHHLAVRKHGQRDLERSPGGLAARGVAVEAEDHVVGELQQLRDVERCSRRSQRGHGVLDPVLGECHDIHVALDHQNLVRVANRAPRLVEAVELAAFFEERGLGGVQVLRLALADDAPAETDHVAARVQDRKHHAIAKAVVAARFPFGLAFVRLAVDHEAGVLQARGGVVGEHGFQVLPPVGRVTQAVARGDLARQPTALEVFDRGLRFLELGAIVGERIHHAGGQSRRLGRPGSIRARARLGHGHAHGLGELADRLRIGEARVLHEEADRVAVGSAAEAVIELLRRAHRE